MERQEEVAGVRAGGGDRAAATGSIDPSVSTIAAYG